MKFVVGTKLVSRGRHPRVAKITEEYSSPYNTPVLELESDLVLEFEDDGSIHDYWTRKDIESLFYEFEYGMIIYCSTGSTQEEFQRAYNLKAFW